MKEEVDMKDFAKSLEDEIKGFERQRERVRAIIGQVGGKPTFVGKIFNIGFVLLVVAAFGLSLVAKGRNEILMLEIIVVLTASKFIYFLFMQAKITHFQFWILSSIEWRLNELAEKIDKMIKGNE